MTLPKGVLNTVRPWIKWQWLTVKPSWPNRLVLGTWDGVNFWRKGSFIHIQIHVEQPCLFTPEYTWGTSHPYTQGQSTQNGFWNVYQGNLLSLSGPWNKPSNFFLLNMYNHVIRKSLNVSHWLSKDPPHHTTSISHAMFSPPFCTPKTALSDFKALSDSDHVAVPTQALIHRAAPWWKRKPKAGGQLRRFLVH